MEIIEYGGYYVVKVFDEGSVNAEVTINSDPIFIANAELDSFCLYLKATGTSPQLQTEYSASFSKDAAVSNWSVQPDDANTVVILDNALKDKWYRESFTPEFGLNLKLIVIGKAGNSANTKVTAYLVFQKKKFLEP